MINCVGIILAGGKNKRMRKDKSLLDFKGKTLLQRIIDEHNQILDNVYVIGKSTEHFKNATGINDKVENKGPIGGLYTAMHEINAEWYLISPCDMPFLNHIDLKIILDECINSEYEAIIAESEKGVEPLVASYNSKILPVINKNINNGNYAVRAFFEQINKKLLILNEQIFEKDIFFNINYPVDYKNALRLYNDN
jgi:molybdopterin-guanine dinucleotide biosynthesis protein A